MYEMKSDNEIAYEVLWSLHREEPPEKLLDASKYRIRRIFDTIDRKLNDNGEFEKVVDFIARYEIFLISKAKEPEEFEIEQRKYNFGNGKLETVFDLAKQWNLIGKRISVPKGLFLYGPISTGKTTTARFIAAFFEAEILAVETIATNYLASDGEDWLRDFLEGNKKRLIVIDDIGNEDEMRKFGNDSPIKRILSARSQSYEWYGVPTVYTSNFLNWEELRKTYGDRIHSRMEGNNRGVFADGPDWRLE